MNTKSISTVVCVVLMSTISVSTMHAAERPRYQKNDFGQLSNACKRFGVTAASRCAFDFVLTNAFLYATTGVHLFSGSRTYLMPFSYSILASSVIFGLRNMSYGKNESYTKQKMQEDAFQSFMICIQNAPFYTFILYCLHLR